MGGHRQTLIPSLLASQCSQSESSTSRERSCFKNKVRAIETKAMLTSGEHMYTIHKQYVYIHIPYIHAHTHTTHTCKDYVIRKSVTLHAN